MICHFEVMVVKMELGCFQEKYRLKVVAVDTWERRHLWEIGGGVPGKAPGAEERAPRGWGRGYRTGIVRY